MHFPAYPNRDETPARCRVALYSHDTMGLGHMRRNLLIAQALGHCSLQAEVLLVCGSREAGTFVLPTGADCLTLPALHKDKHGDYQPRDLRVSLDTLIDIRSNTIRAAMEAFGPDLLIVDNVPRGAVRELDGVLKSLRSQSHTRCVLGLRDVLDDPASVYHQWRRAANDEAIREYYDAVWIYGDPVVYDPVREYRFPLDVAVKARFVGYLDQRARFGSQTDRKTDPLRALNLPPGRLVLCTLGGGQDGARLAEDFVEADLPPDTNGVLVTGPFMPADLRLRLHRRAAGKSRLRVLDFVSEAAFLIERADQVITMGGYNTVGEILSFEKRALVVPRVRPRTEQLIRALRLNELGLLDMLHPDRLSPHALSQWLSQSTQPPPSVRDTIDLNGLSRMPILIRELLSDPQPAPTGQTHKPEVRYAAP